jgi:hypothetical protein
MKYKFWPHLKVTISRLRGGGGALTGVDSPVGELYFAGGAHQDGPYAGSVEFDVCSSTIHIRRFRYLCVDDGFSRDESSGTSLEIARTARSIQIVRVLKAVFASSYKIQAVRPYNDWERNTLDTELLTNGVELLFWPSKTEEPQAKYIRNDPLNLIHVLPSLELCVAGGYDFRRDDLQMATLLDAPSCKKEVGEVLAVARSNRLRVLDYCDALPTFTMLV